MNFVRNLSFVPKIHPIKLDWAKSIMANTQRANQVSHFYFMQISLLNTSSKKALQWLRDNGIEYTEKRITSDPLSLSEFKTILSRTEDGTDEIISTNSQD